jgi:AcrR family transcriptional regulator
VTRNPFEAPAVESRRGGPVKQPLSRDAIVAEALRQVTAYGVKGMSLRKVAAALETGPATLYAYVKDLEELHALILDRALLKVRLPARGATSGWRERLVSVLESYARVLSASPGLAQLAFGRVAVGPNAFRIVDALLAALVEGGVSVTTRAWAVDLLILYVTAIVAEHASGLDPVAPQGAMARALAGVSARDYPQIYAARAQLLSGTSEERFTWAIDVLLQGIRETSRSSRAKGIKHRARPRTPSGRAR